MVDGVLQLMSLWDDFVIADDEPAPAPQRFAPLNVREGQYTGGDTLDEPVWETLRRDLAQIGRRVSAVVWPVQLQQLARRNQQSLVAFALKRGVRLPELVAAVPNTEDTTLEVVPETDWDLWGPLIFSLVYAVAMGVMAPSSQTNAVFSGTFSFIWVFYIVVGLNIQLLGGTISYMAAISATGYLMFPVVVGALVGTQLLWRLVRLPLVALLGTWGVYAALMSLRCQGVLPGRAFLAMYPVGLMYAILSWLVVIT